MMIISGTQETKSLLTTKPICVIQGSRQGLQHSGYPHHAVNSEFPEDISVYKSTNTIKCQFMWDNGDTWTTGQWIPELGQVHVKYVCLVPKIKGTWHWYFILYVIWTKFWHKWLDTVSFMTGFCLVDISPMHSSVSTGLGGSMN